MSIPKNSEFVSHLREMARKAWIIVPVAALVGVAVFVWSDSRPRTFSSTASLRLVVDFEDSSSEGVTDFRTRSYAELALTPAVQEQALEASGLPLTLADVRARTTVELRDTPGFLEISATGPTGSQAAGLANAVAESLVVSVDAEIGPEETTRLELVAPAEVPTAPEGRRPRTDAALAAVVTAILVGELLVLLRKSSGRLSPVGPAFEVGSIFGAPTYSASNDVAGLQAFVGEHLRHHAVLGVIQAGPNATGSTAIALAFAALHDEDYGVVIDADIGHPRLHDAAGIPLQPGLSEVLEGTVALRDAVRANVLQSHVWLLPAGAPSVGAPAGHDRFRRIRELIQGMQIRHVVLSVTSSSRGREAAIVDGTRPHALVVVVDPKYAKARELRRLNDELAATGVPIAAVLLVRDAATSQRQNELVHRPAALTS